MKLEMHKNSIFAVLLRSPWWMSGLVAIALAAGLRIWIPTVYAAFFALPFAVIAVVAAWQQWRAPSAARVAGALERLRGMGWEEFSKAIETGFRREGYTVSPFGDAQADFELVLGARTTLVACKRWKAARTGIEPLRELDAARRTREAHECIWVTAGELTEQARAFAAQKGIRLLEGAELAKLLPGLW
ncbi:MAG: restriction endonuclease [Betaproteobacteria bacterium]|nr:restriction endonuclease [Betaproteobacteria bacterium]